MILLQIIIKIPAGSSFEQLKKEITERINPKFEKIMYTIKGKNSLGFSFRYQEEDEGDKWLADTLKELNKIGKDVLYKYGKTRKTRVIHRKNR